MDLSSNLELHLPRLLAGHIKNNLDLNRFKNQENILHQMNNKATVTHTGETDTFSHLK